MPRLLVRKSTISARQCTIGRGRWAFGRRFPSALSSTTEISIGTTTFSDRRWTSTVDEDKLPRWSSSQSAAAAAAAAAAAGRRRGKLNCSYGRLSSLRRFARWLCTRRRLTLHGNPSACSAVYTVCQNKRRHGNLLFVKSLLRAYAACLINRDIRSKRTHGESK